MLKTRFEWVILLIGVALLGTGWIGFSREPAEPLSSAAELSEAPIAGYLAPDFSTSTTLGEEVTLSDYRGRPVVLNFWATWCPPCRAEMPHFQALNVKYNGLVAILGLDQGEGRSTVSDFGAGLGISYPLLLDTDSQINRQYSVRALPTTFFIDAEGRIREVFSGVINAAVLEDRIERLLAEG